MNLLVAPFLSIVSELSNHKSTLLPPAPSKWIVISGSSYTVLYMICGDFPGGSSRVGEIGLLRRGIPKLSDSARLREILANYSLDVVLDNTPQYDCE